MSFEDEYREYVRDTLQQSFDRELDDQVDRHIRAKVHRLCPDAFFCAALAECKDMFVAGHYYGCICLAQSVAEGLARFVALSSQMRPTGEFTENVRLLEKRGLVSNSVAASLLAVHGSDRNHYHHLNSSVEQHRDNLEARAEECLRGLYDVESELFAVADAGEGRIRPVHRKFWTIETDGSTRVFTRW